MAEIGYRQETEIAVPVVITARTKAEADWMKQHIQHELKMLLKQKKWSTKFKGCRIQQTGSIRFGSFRYDAP